MKKVIIHSFEIPKLTTAQPKIKKIKRWRVYNKIKPKISSRTTYYTKKMDLERFLNLKLPFIDEVINQLWLNEILSIGHLLMSVETTKNQILFQLTRYSAKGQTISEWIYEVIVSPSIRIFNISALTTQGRNPDNFSFVFWEKRWLHKFFLKITDL